MSSLLQKILAIHSSPAICGIKAANLINLKITDELYEEIEELNRKYPNLYFYVLKNDGSNALILIYRKQVLERVLFKEDNKSFLNSIGYDTTSVDTMLESLKERINEDSFPHEIGVFLGYDLSDIKSYIDGKECLYVGYWKVYSNVEKKKEIFDKYTKCKNVVIKMIDKGFPIENFMR